MSLMAQKKGKPGRPKGAVKISVLQLRIHPTLRHQLQKLVDMELTSITAEVTAAIRDRLAAKGLWPPDKGSP